MIFRMVSLSFARKTNLREPTLLPEQQGILFEFSGNYLVFHVSEIVPVAGLCGLVANASRERVMPPPLAGCSLFAVPGLPDSSPLAAR
jgi:hypothetical protein